MNPNIFAGWGINNWRAPMNEAELAVFNQVVTKDWPANVRRPDRTSRYRYADWSLDTSMSIVPYWSMNVGSPTIGYGPQASSLGWRWVNMWGRGRQFDDPAPAPAPTQSTQDTAHAASSTPAESKPLFDWEAIRTRVEEERLRKALADGQRIQMMKEFERIRRGVTPNWGARPTVRIDVPTPPPPR